MMNDLFSSRQREQELKQGYAIEHETTIATRAHILTAEGWRNYTAYLDSVRSVHTAHGDKPLFYPCWARSTYEQIGPTPQGMNGHPEPPYMGYRHQFSDTGKIPFTEAERAALQREGAEQAEEIGRLQREIHRLRAENQELRMRQQSFMQRFDSTVRALQEMGKQAAGEARR